MVSESLTSDCLVVLRRFSVSTGSRSVMGAVEESSALVAIKLLFTPPPQPSLCAMVILTTRQDIHTGR
ncbi:hypothetical protein KM043_016981 [Ampulex compressa]|nr:hypothetical protein KM043_016981 [Ampulex compressa]